MPSLLDHRNFCHAMCLLRLFLAEDWKAVENQICITCNSKLKNQFQVK